MAKEKKVEQHLDEDDSEPKKPELDDEPEEKIPEADDDDTLDEDDLDDSVE